MWEYSDTNRPLIFSFHCFNEFSNSRNVFMPLHDLKMLLSHAEPWAEHSWTAVRSKACCLRGEDVSLDSEPGSPLSLAGPGGWRHVVCRFVNYHSIFMEDPWVCLWEQNPDFNYIPSGYSDYILLRILSLWLSSTLRRCRWVQQRKCLHGVFT